MSIVEVKKRGKVGLMVCGHKEYWPQFPEMKGQFLKNAADFQKLLESQGVDVITYTNQEGNSMVDTTEDGYKSGLLFKAKDIDLLFLYQTAYVASGRYVQGVIAAGCPVVIVGYQKTRDVSKATIYDEHAGGGACPLPEAYNALTRSGIEPAGLEYGHYLVPNYDDRFTKNISEWCRVATALRSYKGAIFGHLGHTYEGMLDMNFDPTTFTRTFGVHVKMIEMCEFVKYVNEAKESDIKEKIKVMKDTFQFMDPSYDPTTRKVTDEDVEWTARCSVGMDKLVLNNNLSGMAYYYEGIDNEYERVAASMVIGNTLLVSKGVPFAGESDMKTCLAMYTTSVLGCGGSFAEFCSTIFEEDIQMVGHDGPHDIRISDAKPLLRALKVFHGKKGSGLTVDFSLKSGPITMLGLSSDVDGNYSFSVAEGESQKGHKPQNGNTQTRGNFGPGVGEFVEQWSTSGINHHFSLSIGHNASVLQKLAKTLNIPFKQVR
jgi:L-arabinose isomerase